MTTHDLSFDDIINNIEKYKGYKIIIQNCEWEIIKKKTYHQSILIACKDTFTTQRDWVRMFPNDVCYWNVDEVVAHEYEFLDSELSEFNYAFHMDKEAYNSHKFNIIINSKDECINIDTILNHLNLKLIN